MTIDLNPYRRQSLSNSQLALPRRAGTFPCPGIDSSLASLESWRVFQKSWFRRVRAIRSDSRVSRDGHLQPKVDHCEDQWMCFAGPHPFETCRANALVQHRYRPDQRPLVREQSVHVLVQQGPARVVQVEPREFAFLHQHARRALVVSDRTTVVERTLWEPCFGGVESRHFNAIHGDPATAALAAAPAGAVLRRMHADAPSHLRRKGELDTMAELAPAHRTRIAPTNWRRLGPRREAT